MEAFWKIIRLSKWVNVNKNENKTNSFRLIFRLGRKYVYEAYEKVKSTPVDEIKETTILNELLRNKERYGFSTNDVLGFTLGMIFAGIETVYLKYFLPQL